MVDALTPNGPTTAAKFTPGGTALPEINAGILGQALLGTTGNKMADEVAGWCARWVKLTLQKANPAASKEIEKLFGGDANDVKWKAAKAGVLNRDMSKLRPGDVVIYDDNHIGIYVGKQNGVDMVRGNNYLTYAKNGGKFDANGRPITPGINPMGTEGLKALGAVAGFVNVGSAVGIGGPTASASSIAAKSFDAYVAEARRILAKVEKYAGGGSAPNPEKWRLATEALTKFKDQSDITARALEYVGTETKKTADKTAGYGQAFDTLKGKLDIANQLDQMGRPAAEVTKHLQAVKTAAEAAAAAEGKRFGTTNGGTEKYRQLSMLAADAAKKLKDIEDRKPQLSPLQKEQQTLAETRAQQALEKAIRGASTARLDSIIKGGVQKEGDLDRVKAAEAELKRRAQLQTEAGKTARKALEDNAALIGKLAEETAKAATARAKEQAALRAKYAAERRDLDVREAQATLTRTQELNAQELKEFKGTQAQRVALIKRQAQDVYNATEQVERATRDKTIRAAQNDINNPNKQRLIDEANQTYKDNVAKARNAQTNAGTQALEDQTKAVREARDGYSKLAAGMRDKIAAGKVELSDLTAYLVSMDQAAEAAEKGGVSQQKYVKGARQSAEAVYQAGIDAQIAAGMFSDLGDGQSLAAKAGREYAVSLEDALAAMPGTIEGNAEYLKLLQDMAKAGQVAGGTVARISDLMRDQALDAEIAAGKYADVVDSYDRAARSAVKYVATQQDAIDQIPGGVEANAAYLKVLQDLEDAGKLAAGTVEAVSQAMRDQETAAAATAAQMTRLTDEAGKTADQYLELGDTDAALDTLQVALDSAMDAAMRGEDAAAAIAELIDRINELTGTTALNDSFNAFVAGLGGTIEEQISAVVDQMERVVDPKMLVKLRSFLADLRQGVTSYEDPSKAGFAPNSNGGGFTNTQPGGAETARAIAAARDFTTALNEELDPATLGTAMTGAADLLASEVGQALPAATRKGLEDGLKNAQAYQDALASITADGIQDGVSRTLNAPAVPDNEFTKWADTIFELGSEGLGDPTTLNGLTESLTKAREAGRLTEDDLQNLLALIREFGAEPDIKLSEKLDLKDMQDGIKQLSDDFDSGKITAPEFVQGLQQAGAELHEFARAARAARNPVLARQFEELADSLRAMNPAVAGALQAIGKFQEYAGYVRDLAGAFAALDDGTSKTDIAANIAGIGVAAGKLVDLAGDVTRIVANPADIGAWVGAITKIVSSVADAIAGFRKAQAEVKKLKEDFQKDNPLLNAGDYQKTFVRSRGFFADVFGGGPEVVNEIDELGLTFAKTMASSFTDGIKGGLRDAIMNNDFSLFKGKLRETVFGGMLDGTLDLFLNKELLQNIIAPAIKAWSDAMKTPDTADDAAALAGLDTAINEVDRLAGKFYDDVAPKFQAIGAQYGITGPQDTRGVDTSNLSTLPEPIQFALATPLLDVGRSMKEAVEVFRGSVGSLDETFRRGLKVEVTGPAGTGTGYLSTTGAL
ncbi:hypothetical protein HLB42_09555 [Deinococcus sp. D7000]|nr:hypothetical protein HLB42_09555 [Deinococcus sp. D7000]